VSKSFDWGATKPNHWPGSHRGYDLLCDHFPPPWQVEQIPGGYKVLDANGQALVYVYARETKAEADIAKVLTSLLAAPI